MLKYSQLTDVEKRDYLFDRGIRPTAYRPAERPDVVSGLLRFSRSAIQSIAHHLLSATLTRVGDELDPPKRKLFHTYGAVARITFTPRVGHAPIYDVLALTEAEEVELNNRGIEGVEALLAHAQKIGTVATDSEFIASSYGDYRLFFKHNASFIRDQFKP